MSYRFSDQAEGLRVVRESGEPPRAMRRHTGTSTRTLAVTSGKGGVGKTQVSANLAVSIAMTGHRVMIVDADLGLAGLDLVLGVRPSSDLMGVVEGRASIQDIIVEGPAGVRLVPACPGRYEMANLGSKERHLLANAIDEVAKGFEVLIIDTGAGIGSNSVSFASGADEVLLVVTPDPTSLRDAYAMAKVLAVRSGVERVQVIANNVRSEAEGLEIFERLEGVVRRFLTLNLEYLGCIPTDEVVRQAVLMGAPFVIEAPRSAAARGMQAVVQRLGFHTPAEQALC